jgi:hypothetical protein
MTCEKTNPGEENIDSTNLGHGKPFLLRQVCVEDACMRSLLNPESAVVRLTSGQSAKSLAFRKG